MKLLLSSLALLSASQLAYSSVVVWGDFSDWEDETLSSTPATQSVAIGPGTLDLEMSYTGQMDSGMIVRDLLSHGETESGLDYDGTNLTAVALFGSTVSSGTGTYTVTLKNINSLDGYDGILYFEGLASTINESAANVVSFSATGTGSVTNWTQEGTFAPNGGNDNDPIFSAIAGTLTVPDVAGNGDASGIFINMGDFSQYTSISITFSTKDGDGSLLSVGAVVPEPSSAALLLGLAAVVTIGARRRTR